jgi:hypothetical protein
MTFFIRPARRYTRLSRRRALETWRDAELLVQLLWDDFLVADVLAPWRVRCLRHRA